MRQKSQISQICKEYFSHVSSFYEQLLTPFYPRPYASSGDFYCLFADPPQGTPTGCH